MYVMLYHKYSAGGRNVARMLGFKHLTRDAAPAILSKNPGKIINWGCPTWPKNAPGQIINLPTSVKLCTNKLKFFQAVQDKVRIPEFTADLETALDWVQDGETVLGRRISGHSGKDIAFFNEDPVKFNESQLWTKYKKKKMEFRVHVMNGKVLFIQKKVLRTEDENGEPIDKTLVDFRIRNHANGFIFQKQNVNPPKDVLDQAIAAVSAVTLDFGAVDVIWNEFEQKAYVLEVNTAPGLDGTSPETYAAGFKELLSA